LQRQQQREFILAQAHQLGRARRRLPQGRRQRAQNLVAHRRAVRLVEQAKAVHVHQQQAEGAALVAQRAEPVEQRAAVRQPRQAIVRRLVQQGLGGGLVLGV